MTTEDEVKQAGVGVFCARFTLMMSDVDQVMLYLGLVPWSKEEQTTKVEALCSLPSSPSCPTIAVQLFSNKGKMWQGCPIAFGPREHPDAKLGLGHTGLLEMIGPGGYVTFPKSDD